MNFDYIKEAEPKNEELAERYEALYRHLEHAEELYWEKPQSCGVLLRKAAEEICKIYNCNYEIGFPESAVLEDYLCYTGEDAHNAMVSRFLSVVRQEQRDRLEWLRVWGDECASLEQNPQEIQKSDDKLYLDTKKMMFAMLEATKEMCTRIDHMENLEQWIFEENILPGYKTQEELDQIEEERKLQEKKQKKKKKSFLEVFFGK